MREILDIEYRSVGTKKLMLDLFLPDGVDCSPLIFWIHGGAWMMGDRKWCGLKNQIERGYAVASVDYRLSTEAPFPACIEDCKHALAFLRKNADQFAIDLTRVCVAGDSAGGHLAALMGVSVGHTDWEPAGSDCSVQAVIDFFGPTQIKRTYPLDPDQDNTVVDKLLGTSVTSAKGRMAAQAASPIPYINGTEPPFLILHGDMDEVVLIEHSYRLRNELEKHGVRVAMHTVWGGAHCFSNTELTEAVVNDFLDYHFSK